MGRNLQAFRISDLLDTLDGSSSIPIRLMFWRGRSLWSVLPTRVNLQWRGVQNENPPPTRPVLPAALRARFNQELQELHKISAFVDSRLESIERFLNRFADQPNETSINDPESDDESVDTPLVSPFPHSDNDSDDGEVLNELIEQ
ncbi:hypothetical protein Tco_0763271 [Tanacetum coccineum]